MPRLVGPAGPRKRPVDAASSVVGRAPPSPGGAATAEFAAEVNGQVRDRQGDDLPAIAGRSRAQQISRETPSPRRPDARSGRKRKRGSEPSARSPAASDA